MGRIHPIVTPHGRRIAAHSITVLIACPAVSPVRRLMNAGRIPPLITATSRMSSQIANARIIIDVRYAMGVPRKLTIPLAALTTAQSLTGLMAPEQYRDVEWIKATWYGNDWLTLIVAVPLLLMSSALPDGDRLARFCCGRVPSATPFTTTRSTCRARR